MAAARHPHTGLTPKQTAFIHAYMQTGNASEAYRRAYDTQDMKPISIRVNACKLKKNANIALTLEQMEVRQMQKHQVSVDSITSELEELRQRALEDKRFSAGITAIMGKAKLHGLDKQHVKAPVKHETTPEERATILRDLLMKAANL